MNLRETQAIVREHLEMDRDPTAAEIEELQASLQRKALGGTLDERGEMLMIRLAVLDPANALRNRNRER